MPSNLPTSEQNDLDAQQRWAAELERDRLAAVMTKPRKPFPGPGAEAGPAAAGEDADEDYEDEDAEDDDSAEGDAEQTSSGIMSGMLGWAKLAWNWLTLPGKMTAIVAAIKIGIPVFAIFMVILVIVGCGSDDSCLLEVGWAIGLTNLFGLGWDVLVTTVFGG